VSLIVLAGPTLHGGDAPWATLAERIGERPSLSHSGSYIYSDAGIHYRLKGCSPCARSVGLLVLAVANSSLRGSYIC